MLMPINVTRPRSTSTPLRSATDFLAPAMLPLQILEITGLPRLVLRRHGAQLRIDHPIEKDATRHRAERDPQPRGLAEEQLGQANEDTGEDQRRNDDGDPVLPRPAVGFGARPAAADEGAL